MLLGNSIKLLFSGDGPKLAGRLGNFKQIQNNTRKFRLLTEPWVCAIPSERGNSYSFFPYIYYSSFLSRRQISKNYIDSNCKDSNMLKAHQQKRNTIYLLGYFKIRVYNIVNNLMPVLHEKKKEIKEMHMKRNFGQISSLTFISSCRKIVLSYFCQAFVGN